MTYPATSFEQEVKEVTPGWRQSHKFETYYLSATGVSDREAINLARSTFSLPNLTTDDLGWIRAPRNQRPYWLLTRQAIQSRRQARSAEVTR